MLNYPNFLSTVCHWADQEAITSYMWLLIFKIK